MLYHNIIILIVTNSRLRWRREEVGMNDCVGSGVERWAKVGGGERMAGEWW